MTCKEKLKLIRPDIPEDDILAYCPYDFYIMPKPEYCEKNMPNCEKCWDREILGFNSANIYVSDDYPKSVGNKHNKTKYKIFFGTHDFNGAVSADELLNQWVDEHPGVRYSFLGYQHTRYGDHSILISYEEE